MDIVDVTEIFAINLEKENLIENAEYHNKKLVALFLTKNTKQFNFSTKASS